MKKTFILACIYMLFLVPLSAQVILKGQVVNQDKLPLEGVTITTDQQGVNTMSDQHGFFQFDHIRKSRIRLIVTALGYPAFEKTIQLNANETTNITITLTDEPNVMNEVVIHEKQQQYTKTNVSSTLRLNEPILETPQNIKVITAVSLSNQQVISMYDGVIRNFSGATRLEHWGDLYTRINMRGGRASAFRNGFNVTSDWGPLSEDMSFVERIEVVKGPAGFMMSNSEPTGIYNVVTKKPTGTGFKGEAAVLGGSFDLYRLAVDLDGSMDKKNKLLYRINVMGQHKGSFRPSEYDHRYSIAPVLTYRFNDKTSLTLEYTYQYAKMSDLGGRYVFGTAGYSTLPRNFTMSAPDLPPTKINDNSLFLSFQHAFNDHWKLTAQGSYFDYYQNGTSQWPSSVLSNGDIYRQVSIWESASKMKFGQAFINGDVHTGSVHHRLLGGVDYGNKGYIADWNQTRALDSATRPFNVYTSTSRAPSNGYPVFNYATSLSERAGQYGVISQEYTGVYAQDELGFFKDVLRLTVAARYTYVTENSYGTTVDDQKVTPRIGLSWSVTKNTAFYALYDQSFVPQSGLFRAENRKAKPITGNNMEIGLKESWLDGRWNATLSAYKIIQNNTLTSDPNNTPSESFVLDVGQSTTKGIEFDIQGELARGFNAIANYAYTDSRISEASATSTDLSTVGSKIPGYAAHVANAWLDYTIQSSAVKGLGIAAGFNYQAGRSTWNWVDVDDGQQVLPDYFRLDGGLFYTRGHVRITANMYNLLNAYLYSGSYYGGGATGYYYWQTEAGRNFRIGINYFF